MLTQMRALSQNIVGRTILAIVLGFIILSFAVWGIGDRFSGYNASQLATVGSTRISVDEYRTAYQNQLQEMQQKARRAITNVEARRMGLDRQVLSRILSNAILDQEAGKLGLAVGDTEIVREITRDPVFKGANGQFDRNRFESLLANNNMSEAMYVRDQRAVVLRQDVSQAVIGGLEPPAAMKEAIHRYQGEVRDFTFFTLPASTAGQVPAATPAELQQLYDERPTAFTAPEYRKLVVLAIVPVDLVKPDQISDADTRKRYEEMKAARFVVPEKRTLEQLYYPDAGAAKAAREKLDKGASFADLLKDEKKTEGDASLGTVTKEQLPEKALGDAAFALPEGGTSQTVKTQFGSVLVHVSKIVPGRQQAYEEVAPQLKNELAIVRAKAQAGKQRDAIEDQRTAGKSLTEAAAAVGLKPRTIEAIDAQGFDKAHKPVEGLVDGPALLKAAFGSDIGADTEMLQTADGGDVWYEVAGIDAAHKLPLADVKPRVEAMWRGEATARRLAKESESMVAEIDHGKSLLEVAAAHGNLKVAKATDVARTGAPEVPPGLVNAVFGTTTGKAGAAPAQGGRAIFQVAAARVPPIPASDPELDKIMAQVKEGVVDDVLAQYLSVAQKEIGVQLNERALATALGNSDSGS